MRIATPVIEPVPAALTEPVTVPPLIGRTEADLWRYVVVLHGAVDKLNARLKAIAGLSGKPEK